jgi:raffinose/stachyose/melibiose transport system permease protein
MASASAAGVRATRNAKAWLGILFVAPTLVLTVVFFLFPLASAVYFSLTSWNGTTVQAPFVGLSNFTAMATDPEVLHALGNNAIWVVIGTAAPLIVGLVLAVILWTGVSAVLLYRLVFFLPFVLPGVAIGIVWGWIYDPVNGWLNRLLGYVGLEEFARGWLGEPGSALYAVLAAAIWATFGFVVVIFLAALQNVDLDQVDAARLDGAGSLQRLWYVIMPQIMPVFLMVTTITLVGGISVFDIVFIMTGGGPGNATSVLGTYAYENAFQLNKIGYGTALALLIAVLSVPIVVLLNHVQRRLSDR